MEIWNYRPENDSESSSSYGLPEIKVQELHIYVSKGALNYPTEHHRKMMHIDVYFDKERIDLFRLGVCDLERGADCFGQEKHYYQEFDDLLKQFKNATEEEQRSLSIRFLNKAIDFAIHYNPYEAYKLFLYPMQSVYRSGVQSGKKEIRSGFAKLLDLDESDGGW